MCLDSLRKIILGLGLMLLSSAAFSFSLNNYNGGCGSAQVALGPTDGRYALADSHRNLIVIDPYTARTFSTRAVKFIFFHECGHLRYGHSYSAYGTVKQDHEDKADCYAAKRYIGHFGRGNLRAALKELESINGEARNNHILNCK